MHVAHAVCDAEEYLQGSYERFVDHIECPIGYIHICHRLHVQV